MIKYATLGFLLIYGCLMSAIVGLQFSDNYKSVDFTLIKLILKSLKLVTDIGMHVLFMQLLIFFVRYKKKQTIPVIYSQDAPNYLSAKNKATIVWICFLYTLTVINVIFVFLQGILTYEDPSLFDDGTFLDRLFNFVALLIYPLKDFLIAVSFAALYQYQGLNESKKKKAI